MGQAWRDWGGVVLTSLVVLPVVVLVVAGLARRRTARGVPARRAWWRGAAEVGMVAGTLPWLWMTMTPRAAPREAHLVPLRDLAAQVGDGPTTAVAQIVGNLLVFAAFGFFAPVRFPALAGVGRVLASAAAGSVVIEVLQYALHLGRVSSVDDVLLNAAGAALAAAASRRWWAGRDVPYMNDRSVPA